MQFVVISTLDTTEDRIEVVERKGLGHPDTICDALAETLSRNLCREYLGRCGRILHHNVDKALLCGGRAAPAFRGGAVLAPITIYMAGRATTRIANEEIRIKELVVEGSRCWLRENLHALDVERHVEIHELIQPGSQDLQGLFSRRGDQLVPLANDTSIGVGYAPMTSLERLVLSAEQRINNRERESTHPAWGEDVKIMGVRRDNTVSLMVACAMIGSHLVNIDDYLSEKAVVANMLRELAIKHDFSGCEVTVQLCGSVVMALVAITDWRTQCAGK